LHLAAPPLVLAPALLEPRDGAREVDALAGEELLGGLEGARGDAVTARDRQREALADGVVREPEARRAARRVDVERGDLEFGRREGEGLHLREVRGEGEARAAREEVGQHADGERRALDRIRPRAGLVE